MGETQGLDVEYLSSMVLLSSTLTEKLMCTNTKQTRATVKWKVQRAELHVPNVDLIKQFDEILLNDYDLRLRAHPAQENGELEKMNVKAELLGRNAESPGRSLGEVTLSKDYIHQASLSKIWFPIVKIILFAVAGFLVSGSVCGLIKRFKLDPVSMA